MILKNENSIYMFYEAIEQLEPEKILDVGMFLKRTGAVSRKVMSRDIPEDRQLTGIDFFPELTFPVCCFPSLSAAVIIEILCNPIHFYL